MTKFRSQSDGSIAKWGNSQAVRLSTDILRQADFEPTGPVRITAERGRITIEPIRRKVSLDDLLAQLPPDCRMDLVDYGSPVGREVP